MATLKIPVSSSDHIQGNERAPVVLIEYGDYECPHCGHAYPIVKQLQEKFGKKLRFVFRNFPLREIHPHAEEAAETAEFAGAHGKFWEMHDMIFENQQALGDRLFVELSLKSGEFAERVEEEFSSGARSGVNGTPTFFINGQRHDADFELQTLTDAVNEALG
jgi:protein-disulfide isomerase